MLEQKVAKKSKFLMTTHNNYSPWTKEIVELSEAEIESKKEGMKQQRWDIGENGEIYDIVEFGYKAARTYTPVES
jgi:hypothetical protein